jgi:hypothetical protein
MQDTPDPKAPARRHLGFAIQLAVLGLMLLGLMALPRHYGEAPLVGSNGAVLGYHGD